MDIDPDEAGVFQGADSSVFALPAEVEVEAWSLFTFAFRNNL